jgi:pSer/pThr/pTyr-binding forkhead associated (FHA) protein
VPFDRAELVGPWARPIVLRPGCLVRLGRAPTSDVVVDHPSVSRSHAAIEWRADGTIYLSDLGSSNGTRLDKAAVLKDKPIALADGASIALGDVMLNLRFGASDLSADARGGKFDSRAALRKVLVELERTNHTGTLELTCGEQKIRFGYDKGVVVAAQSTSATGTEEEGFPVIDELLEGAWAHRGSYRIADALELPRQPLRVRMSEVMIDPPEAPDKRTRETERMKRRYL